MDLVQQEINMEIKIAKVNSLSELIENFNSLLQETEENQEKVAEEIKVQKNQEQERKRLLTKLKSDIDNKIIEVTIKLGANGKKFGNVSKTVICDEFEKKYGLHLNKKDVELSSDINSVGIYTVKVKLDTDIVAEFEVKVLEEKSEK